MQQPPSYQTTDDDPLEDQPTTVTVTPQAVQSAQDPRQAPTPEVVRTARAVRRLPIARVIGVIFIVIVLAILVGVGYYQVQIAQRQAGYNIDLYPNSTLRSQRKISNSSDESVYSTTDGPDVVGKYYMDKLGKSGAGDNGNDNGCRLLFAVYLPTTAPWSEPIPRSQLPGDNYYRCSVNNSLNSATQITTLEVRYEKPSQRTVITIRRDWGGQ
jgi:hypothetical protein